MNKRIKEIIEMRDELATFLPIADSEGNIKIPFSEYCRLCEEARKYKDIQDIIAKHT